MSERDYLERTIETVRNHRDAENCWPQWANIFADEIERLWSLEEQLETLREALHDIMQFAIDEGAIPDASEEDYLSGRAQSNEQILYEKVQKALEYEYRGMTVTTILPPTPNPAREPS